MYCNSVRGVSALIIRRLQVPVWSSVLASVDTSRQFFVTCIVSCCQYVSGYCPAHRGVGRVCSVVVMLVSVSLLVA